MNNARLMLCTDMDRTVIPNGAQPEHPGARERLRAFCAQHHVLLVYVSGRHQALVKQAIDEYSLPSPDYIITDVGTKIYHASSQGWCEDLAWESQLDASWQDLSHQRLIQLLGDITGLEPQEAEKQNSHKLSFYLPLSDDVDTSLQGIRARLEQAGLRLAVIWSIDEARQIGLLDLIPEQATKLHGIEFLMQQLGYAAEEVVFAGDSGNDLPVLCSPLHSVLVANASTELKTQALQLCRSKGTAATLYIAADDGVSRWGNYADGVLQGVCHFRPDMCVMAASTGGGHAGG